MILDTLLSIPAAQLAGFVAAGLALNLAPGQDVMFASACGLRGGPRAGAFAGIGVGFGVVMHVTLATMGLGALIAAHPEALIAIKWAGAAYLLWLAGAAWHDTGASHAQAAPERGLRLIARGALSNLLNPKPVLFLLAFLPQFTSPGYGPIWHQFLGLGLIFAFTGMLVTIAYGVTAGIAVRSLGSRMGWLNRIAAVLFAGLAIRLVAR